MARGEAVAFSDVYIQHKVGPMRRRALENAANRASLADPELGI
jgi:hypothetical protein